MMPQPITSPRTRLGVCVQCHVLSIGHAPWVQRHVFSIPSLTGDERSRLGLRGMCSPSRHLMGTNGHAVCVQRHMFSIPALTGDEWSRPIRAAPRVHHLGTNWGRTVTPRLLRHVFTIPALTGDERSHPMCVAPRVLHPGINWGRRVTSYACSATCPPSRH
jgi:hypothetical protein